ncbi:Malto-oligosyltrehalose trehalohydrolase [Saccharolobus shibatae B12]|uniref:Malto-oligosyltrehalose trehalohydrolase n=1 Tax=Saccharolobus shibatae (strain ATCC 51178 / DSM 5389 / JCM 8931 / NBRC 15437 / B12) TaxID=523848 RepID=A0A8F5BQ19_SACSH|nr:malto-oligosyltrehalose trehalohydrolase [Saccharolobus shibatae]QXJ29375.1 Malto-oligosyltrehalose trehalohydrolase [Saccharolobus shibatae B12]
MTFGYKIDGNEVIFTLWAPYQKSVKLKVLEKGLYEMERDDKGYFTITLNNVKVGDRYKYVLDDASEIPDPASRYQPEGVHGPSQIIQESKEFNNETFLKKEDLIIYEIHVGTFAPEGTFEGVIRKLDYLKDLGITAIEIMPIAQFPGKRDWGYDGVYLYAVQNSYGGPEGFRKLVDEAHMKGLGVILDVVYNHVGPEGNYMVKLGPYFSQKYKTPWGLTFNFDDAESDEVRKFILENVEYWIKEYNVDGFRLDAVHSIIDTSPKHILEEIADVVHKYNRIVIAESDLNDPRVVNPKEKCGYNIDAQWVDDFHHSIHAYLTGERQGYYLDFGNLDNIVKSYKDVFVYDGKYSKFRRKTHGKPVGELDGCNFVVYIQNHDQVGNRGKGERIIKLVDKESYKIAAALYILSPYIPMIFMGEEYGEQNPFYFFSDFSDTKLIQGLREGRKKENGQDTDPQDESTFNASKLSWKIDEEIFSFYKILIKMRNELSIACDRRVYVENGENWLIIKGREYLSLCVFSRSSIEVKYSGTLLLSSNNSFPQHIEEGKYEFDKGFALYKL